MIVRTPPHSVDAEMGVISSMMISPNDNVPECADKITTEFFYVPAHQTIFAQMVDLWKSGKPVDLLTLTQLLRDRNLLDAVGGAACVTSIYTFIPSAANLQYYLDILRDKFVLRQVIVAATETVRRAYEEQDDANSVLERFQTDAIDIAHIGHEDRTSGPLSKYIPGAVEEILWHYHNRGHCSGISTGFVDLDRMMNGFEKGVRPYCFAARPSMGKSAIMLQMAYNIAIAAAAQKRRVKIFSIEMTARSLAKRMIASAGSLNLKALRFGFLDKGGEERTREAAARLTTDYINIDEKGDLSIVEFRARARRAVLKDKCEIILVDYLQRMQGSSKRSHDNRQLEINEIAQGFSQASKELNVPIVVLAQLNRNPEDRRDGKPELGDLRESGSIEQEMGFVGLLWRPSYYAAWGTDKANSIISRLREQKRQAAKGQDNQADLEAAASAFLNDQKEYEQYAECIVAKQNEGPVGPIPLRFIDTYARYESEDPDRPLFSNNPDKRQQKPNESPPARTAPPAHVQEIFPGASVLEDQPDES